MPSLIPSYVLALASLQLLINNVLGQNSYFSKFPTCAQDYLAAAEPAECNDGETTATDHCLCSNTGDFLTNSAKAIGQYCGCADLTTSAYLLVSICNDYAGGISMDEGQIIAAGSSGNPTCQTTSVTTTSSSSSSATSSSTPSTTSTPGPSPVPDHHSHGGIDTDGIISLAVGLPCAILASIEIIGRVVSEISAIQVSRNALGQPTARSA